MKDLLSFIVEGITGTTEFEVEETVDGRKIDLLIKADPEIMGMIIGKQGSTIRAIRHLLRVKSTLDQTSVFVEVTEKTE